mmetsp:Transcript_14261/g.43181  ORF Transcript_14261/g.43181 Transcript_14261/m.43181 type:complete len:242 (-) Transcript_14261:468-1193(-)
MPLTPTERLRAKNRRREERREAERAAPKDAVRAKKQRARKRAEREAAEGEVEMQLSADGGAEVDARTAARDVVPEQRDVEASPVPPAPEPQADWRVRVEEAAARGREATLSAAREALSAEAERDRRAADAAEAALRGVWSDVEAAHEELAATRAKRRRLEASNRELEEKLRTANVIARQLRRTHLADVRARLLALLRDLSSEPPSSSSFDASSSLRRTTTTPLRRGDEHHATACSPSSMSL